MSTIVPITVIPRRAIVLNRRPTRISTIVHVSTGVAQTKCDRPPPPSRGRCVDVSSDLMPSVPPCVVLNSDHGRGQDDRSRQHLASR
jgi:hypothetical protein